MQEIIYFSPVTGDESTEKLQKMVGRIFSAAGLSEVAGPNDLTAIKIHFGEDENSTHIPAPLVRPVAEAISAREAHPFLTDTCVLYRSRRDNAVEHLRQARDHGFTPDVTGAPVIIADGLVGDAEREVEIKGMIFKKVSIAAAALQANSLITMTHITGHLATGMGGTIKNLGMGFSSRKGKLRQHSVSKPKIKAKYCTLCGECRRWCPADAISLTESTAVIDKNLCIGCGECLAVCRFGAVAFDWKVDAGELQRRIAEHALGVVSGKQDKCGYLSFLISMTRDCDCMNWKQKPAIPDIGILAGRDPVAMDAAALTFIAERAAGRLDEVLYAGIDAWEQIRHGEKIGLGRKEFILETVD